MNGPSHTPEGSVPLTLDWHIERVCGQFEAAWKTATSVSQAPRIDEYLGDTTEPERSALLQELILADVYHRRLHGKEPQAADYVGRFPALDAMWLARAVAGPADVAKEQLSDSAKPAARPAANAGDHIADGAKRLRCPHCHSPIQLADTQLDEVLCPACGGSFHVQDTQLTATQSPMRQLGKFQLLERMGVGAFGAVWRARDTQLDRIVALKIPHASLLSSPPDLERFHREARAAAQLRHPGIVPVHEVTTLEGLPALVSDFIQGVPLRELLQVRRLTFREAATLVAQVADALDHAHAMGLVHRDVKPANIMIEYARGQGLGTPLDGGPTSESGSSCATSSGVQSSTSGSQLSSPRPLLLDFGLALRSEAEVKMTVEGQIIGTPAYMSPEQATGRGHEADARTDVYSLGVVLYELLCGELPFRGSRVMMVQQVLNDEPRPPRRVNEKIPRDLETITLKAMAKSPARRYATARELADDLGRFLRQEPILARPISTSERIVKWARRKPALAALVVVSLLATVSLLGGGVVFTMRLRTEKKAAQEALLKVDRARVRAEGAERDARENLWQAYLDQARAGRWSGRVGRWFESLEALVKAADIRPSLELRNEAIACMTLVDLRVGKQWGATLSGYSCDFDPTLERYAISDDTGTISIRSVGDNSEVQHLPGPGEHAWVVRFSPDGRHLSAKYHPAGREWPNELSVWDWERGAKVLNVPGAGYDHNFSPDSRRLAVFTPDRSIQLWDLASCREIKRVESVTMPGGSAFDPTGARLAVSSSQQPVVQIRDLETGKLLTTLQHPAGARGVAWSSDGKSLAVACSDFRVYIWNADTGGRQAVLIGHEAEATNVAFNHRGDLLASTGWDRTTRLWDPRSGRLLISTAGQSIRFSRDDRRLAFWDTSQVGVWEVATGLERRTYSSDEPKTTKGSWRADFSPDGGVLASAHPDGVRFWDLMSDQQVTHLRVGDCQAAIFHQGGKSLLTCSQSGVKRWPIQGSPDPVTGDLQVGPPETLLQFGKHVRGYQACLCADGRTLAVIDRGNVVLIDLQEPSRKVSLAGHDNAAYVAISPDGQWVAASTWWSQPEMVRVTHVPTGKLVWQVDVLLSTPVAFSPDGTWLLTCGEECRFWQVGTWQPGPVIQKDSVLGRPVFATFSPDGQMLAVAGSNGLVRLLDASNFDELATLPDASQITWLSFSRDGSQLAVSCTTHVTYVWDLRLIRQQLAAMNLDWNVPPYSSDGEPRISAPVHVTVDLGDLAQPAPPAEQTIEQRLQAELERYTQALEANPNDAQNCNNLAWILATGPEGMRDPEKALSLAQKAVELAPRTWLYLNTLGVAFYRAGQYDKAVETLLEGVFQSSDGASAFDLFFLAMSYQHLAQPERARACYDRAIQWRQRQTNLPARWREELEMFRQEADQLLPERKDK